MTKRMRRRIGQAYRKEVAPKSIRRRKTILSKDGDEKYQEEEDKKSIGNEKYQEEEGKDKTTMDKQEVHENEVDRQDHPLHQQLRPSCS